MRSKPARLCHVYWLSTTLQCGPCASRDRAHRRQRPHNQPCGFHHLLCCRPRRLGARRFLADSHLGASLERLRIGLSDSQQAWTKLDGGQCTGVDLFVNLFAADEPIRRQFGNGYVRCRMRLKILDYHADSSECVKLMVTGESCVSALAAIRETSEHARGVGLLVVGTKDRSSVKRFESPSGRADRVYPARSDYASRARTNWPKPPSPGCLVRPQGKFDCPIVAACSKASPPSVHPSVFRA